MKKFAFILVGTSISFLSCKKAKLEKNLEGNWTAATFVEENDQYVDENSSVQLEFKNIDDGNGDLIFKLTEDMILYTYPGTFTLNNDYSKMDATVETNDPAVDWVWNVDITVDEGYLGMIGTSKYSDEAVTYTFNVAATN